MSAPLREKMLSTLLDSFPQEKKADILNEALMNKCVRVS